MTQPNDQPVGRRRSNWPRRVALTLGLVVILGLIAGGWFWFDAQRQLDRMAERHRQAGEYGTIDDLVPPPLADEDNAIVLLREAWSVYSKPAAYSQLSESAALALPLTAAESSTVAEAMRANPQVYALIDAARAKPGVRWNDPITPGNLLGNWEGLKEIRELTLFLRDSSLHDVQAGRTASALAHLDRVWFLADATGNRRTVLPHLLAVGMRATVADAVRQLPLDMPEARQGSPTRAQMQAMMLALADTNAAIREFELAVHGERVWCVAVLTESLGKSIATRAIARRSAARISERIVLMIPAVKAGNWPDAQRLLPPDDSKQSSNPTRLIGQTLEPAYQQLIRTEFRARMDRRAAAIAIAMRLYVADHRKLPEKLDELNEYLPSDVLIDPFRTDGGNIGYMVRNGEPYVYSVGSDGVDQGGDDTPLRSNTTRAVSEWERHDAIFRLTQSPREQSDTPPVQE
jgi:hypothetical protein